MEQLFNFTKSSWKLKWRRNEKFNRKKINMREIFQKIQQKILKWQKYKVVEDKSRRSNMQTTGDSEELGGQVGGTEGESWKEKSN